MFIENFSIGLDFVPQDEPGSIRLLRCNGPHGPHRLWSHHTRFHIHQTKAEDLNNGLKVEAFAEITVAYGSFEEAIRQFGSICQIVDWGECFPAIQADLFPDLS